MKKDLERLYIDSINKDVPPNVFAEQVLDLFGVSHSTILNGTDELNTYGKKHREDCEKIKAALVNNGYANAGLSDAVFLWSDYSDTYAAGWLGLPDTEEEIFDCVKDYIRNPYCG